MDDIFADLLKPVVNKDTSNNGNTLLKSRSNNVNLDLDFLDNYVSKPVNNSNNNNSNNNNNDLFGDLLSDRPLSKNNNTQIKNNFNNNDDLLDLGFNVNTKTNNNNNNNNINTNTFDDLLGGMDQKPVQKAPINEPSAFNNSTSLRDSALAELLDMGFPISKANTALDSTSSGYDLNEAISYLMNNAHKTKSTSNINSFPKPQQPDDFSKIVNDLSTDFMSTASFLFNSSKKQLQKGVEMYKNSNRREIGDGTPAWMKDQHRYMRDSINLPDEEDNDYINEQHEVIREPEVRKPVLRNTPKKKPQLQPQPITVSSAPLPPGESVSSSSLLDLSVPKFLIPPLNSAQLHSYTSFRKIAQEKFKNGDYVLSLENYSSASNDIPIDHPFQIILFLNISIIYSKLGNHKDQLIYANKGLELISIITKNVNINSLNEFIIEDGKSIKSFWSKLMFKKAESLEFLEKWNESKIAYETLISSGECSKPIMDGKNRCLKSLSPKPVTKPMSKPTPKSQTITIDNNNEKLQRVKKNNELKIREDEEKFKLHDIIENKLNNWREGNKDNIRGLLCSLDKILWPSLNWKPIQLTDLVLDKKVKIFYMKAVAKTHPDKISNNETIENKMIANGVFITLNEAWEKFKDK